MNQETKHVMKDNLYLLKQTLYAIKELIFVNYFNSLSKHNVD